MKEIPLTKGYVALVDDEDYETLSQYRWVAATSKSNVVYARCNAYHGQAHVYMHRLLCPTDDKKLSVDHIDRNGLNNQRNNLRLATKAQQNANRLKRSGATTSKYKGVHYDKRSGKWTTRVFSNGHNKHIGAYDDEKTAAVAYNEYVFRLYGDYVVLNEV